MTGEEFKTGVREDGTTVLSKMHEAFEVVRMIDALRAGEGWAVTIWHDNPDEGPNCVIECEGAWVGGMPLPDEWHPRRTFGGDSILECLRAAHKAMTEAKP